jgi:hypothetical protein
MAIVIRLTLGLAVVLAALMIAVVLVKLVVGIAVLGALAFGGLYAVNFVRALLRQPAVRAAERATAPAVLGR